MEKTIYEILRNNVIPKDEDARKEVESVVAIIKEHIIKNHRQIWKNRKFDCFAKEISRDFFNGCQIPEGERTFILVRDEKDLSYLDYYYSKNNHYNAYKVVCTYNFTYQQDKYFQFLMAREGAIRDVIECAGMPSEINWYLI